MRANRFLAATEQFGDVSDWTIFYKRQGQYLRLSAREAAHDNPQLVVRNLCVARQKGPLLAQPCKQPKLGHVPATGRDRPVRGHTPDPARRIIERCDS